eukprot:485421-Pleurochrysis_carterae.AAC.1
MGDVARRGCAHGLHQFPQELQHRARPCAAQPTPAAMPRHEEHGRPDLTGAVDELVEELRE